MNIALSNLAWDKEESESIYSLLNELNIKHIEGVLPKINSWDNLSEKELRNFKSNLNDYSLSCYSLQSLFFNVPVNTLNEHNAIVDHFTKLFSYSKILGSKILVLGSPNLRKKENEKWYNNLEDLFYRLDVLLDNFNIKIVIEPNSKIYKGEYFYSCSEITKFISSNKYINIKTMIDTHNLLLENVDIFKELNENFDYISHIHVSEKELKPVNFNNFHKDFLNELISLKYANAITYEVKKCKDIELSIKEFASIYL